MGTMEDFVDTTLVLALCCVPLLWVPPDPFAVTGALGAVILACLGPAGAPSWLRWGAAAAFLATAALWPAWSFFLPMGAYISLRERPWPLRLAWLVALAAVLAQGALSASAAASLCALCAVAAMLAVRETRASAERTALRAMRDGLRESMMRQAAPATPGAVGATIPRDAHEPVSKAASDGPRDPSASCAFDDLTQRELAIVQLVARGLDNKEIAARLFLSEGTVRNHISAVLQKRELKNRTQLAVEYLGAPLG